MMDCEHDLMTTARDPHDRLGQDGQPPAENWRRRLRQ